MMLYVKILIVVLFVALVVGAYRLWQDKNPPVNIFEGWQTVKSDEMYISFKVPNDWEYEGTNRAPQDQIMYAGPNGEYLTIRKSKLDDLSLNIGATLVGFDLNREINSRGGNLNEITVRETAPITIVGWSAIRRIESHASPYEPEEIVTYVNAYGYNYSISTWRQEKDTSKPVKTVTPDDIALHQKIESSVQIWHAENVRAPSTNN